MKRSRIPPSTIVLVILLLLAIGLFAYARRQVTNEPQKGVVASGKDAISVFFPDEEGKLQKKLVDVQKQLPDKVRGDLLFRELKKERCIPDRLKLYEMAFGEGGVLYLNVSREFTEYSTTTKEMTMTYGIVNSFIESFKNVKSVQLLVEGQPVYTKSGLLYLYAPLQFNRDILEE